MNNYSRGGSRPRSRGSFKGSFSYSSGGNRGRGRGGRRGSSNGPVNESLYIKKAQPIAEQTLYTPSYKYSDLQVHPTLKQNIVRKGYQDPTPVQDQSIPQILEGHDLLGVANTGTGKTAAFLIPLLHKAASSRDNQTLILVPTRELAQQIHDELYELSKDMRVFSVKCVGGEPMYRQIKQLSRGVQFVVATPGRMKDLTNRKVAKLHTFNNVVLDEVDRMLDMGFVDDIRFLISQLPDEKQSLFFSATMNRNVEQLMEQILKPGYKKVSVATGVTAKNINQDVIHYTHPEDKVEKLKELLSKTTPDKVLVFANTKREVDKLERLLKRESYGVEALHGDKRQNWRRKAIENFKKDKNVLIATDVAARGLDIQGVALVINYDVPNNHEDYVHRIGRTGRAGRAGDALTFVQKRKYG